MAPKDAPQEIAALRDALKNNKKDLKDLLQDQMNKGQPSGLARKVFTIARDILKGFDICNKHLDLRDDQAIQRDRALSDLAKDQDDRKEELDQSAAETNQKLQAFNDKVDKLRAWETHLETSQGILDQLLSKDGSSVIKGRDQLSQDCQQLRTNGADLQRQIERLTSDNDQLRGDYHRLKRANDKLQGDHDRLQGAHGELQSHRDQLQGDKERAQRANVELQCQIRTLQEHVANLKQQRQSSFTGKPRERRPASNSDGPDPKRQRVRPASAPSDNRWRQSRDRREYMLAIRGRHTSQDLLQQSHTSDLEGLHFDRLAIQAPPAQPESDELEAVQLASLETFYAEQHERHANHGQPGETEAGAPSPLSQPPTGLAAEVAAMRRAVEDKLV